MLQARVECGTSLDLVERYEWFMDSAAIRGCQRRGGQVFVATERRAAAVVATLIRLGQRLFAEKFVQEVAEKWSAIAGGAGGLVLHGFGRLQTNKVKPALALFDALEALDRVKLASALARQRRADDRAAKFYVQVNTGREPQKGGVAPDELEPLFRAVREEYGIPVAGLMAIPPRHEDPDSHFKWLRRSADKLRLPECIMGMSNDYAQAINCGSTAIRIGRAILG